jgi:hypothetical protein
VQDLDHPPGGGDVELVVERPHVIGPLSEEPASRRGRDTETLAFAALRRHPQALLPPQPLDLLAVHGVTVTA